MKSPLIYLSDDAACIQLLQESGNLDVLAVPPGKYSATLCFEHEGYYVMANHFDHHDQPGDNGYTVLLIPTSAMSKDEAGLLFADLIHKLTGGQHTVVQLPKEA